MFLLFLISIIASTFLGKNRVKEGLLDMEKNRNTDDNKNDKSYRDQEKEQLITNLAHVLKSSKYNDKDNEDM